VADSLIGLWKYPAIFIALMAAGLGFPIPEEIPVVTAGGLCAKAASEDPIEPPEWAAALALPGVQADPVLAAAAAADWAARKTAPHPRRHPVWWIMLPVCIAGVVTCDAFLYVIGRWGGTRLLERPWVQRYVIKPEKRAKIERNFQKYGVRILLGVRLLPGVRAPVFVMAGVVRLPLTRFLLADGLYAIPGVTLLFTLAYWFTDQVLEIIMQFEGQVSSLKSYFIICGIAAFGCWLLYEYLKRRVMTGDPKEVPLIGEKMIKPPHPPVDKAGSVLIAPLAEQQAEAQEKNKTQETLPKTEGSREKWSLKSYLLVGTVVVVACWAAYESARRIRKR
jgi:membrane protein DedA with SNARE-associated domain